MTADQILELAGQFGPMGFFIGYLVWDRSQERSLARERIETDKAVACSMTLLAAKIDGMKS